MRMHLSKVIHVARVGLLNLALEKRSWNSHHIILTTLKKCTAIIFLISSVIFFMNYNNYETCDHLFSERNEEHRSRVSICHSKFVWRSRSPHLKILRRNCLSFFRRTLSSKRQDLHLACSPAVPSCRRSSYNESRAGGKNDRVFCRSDFV